MPLAMFLGAMGRAWLISISRPNENFWEQLSRSNFVFAVLLTGFWLTLVFRQRLKSKRADTPRVSYFPSFTGLSSGVWWFLFVIGAVSVVMRFWPNNRSKCELDQWKFW